jgi:hypothetical protein
MKTLITALAVTAILATSAVAKTQRTREVRIQPNNSLSHNSVSRNPVAQLDDSYCRFHNGIPILTPESVSSLCATVRNTKTATQNDAGFCIGLTRTRKLRGRGWDLQPRRCLVTLQAL